MSSHHVIPTCTVPSTPNTTGTTSVRHCHMQLTFTRKSLYFVNFSACDVTLSRTADITKKANICHLISETDVSTIGTDLPSSRDDYIPHYSAVVHLHKVIRMMPVPSPLQWNPRMTTNVPVDNGGHLIVLISVVYRFQGTTACCNISHPSEVLA